MNIIKEFTRRFKGNKTLEGIDHEAIWSGIESHLDQLETQKDHKRKRLIFLLLLFSIFGSGVLTFCFVNLQVNEVAQSISLPKINKKKPIPKKEIESENPQTNIAQLEGVINSLNSKNESFLNKKNKLTAYPKSNTNTSFKQLNHISKKVNNLNFLIDNKQVSSILDQELENTITHARKNTFSDSSVKPEVDVIPWTKQIQSPSKDRGNVLPNQVGLRNNNTTTDYSFSKLYSIPLSLSGNNYQLNKVYLPTIEKRSNVHKSMNTQFKIGSSIGISTLINFFGEHSTNSELNNRLNTSTSSSIGYSSSLNLFWFKSDNFFIKSGIEYHQNHLKFSIVHVSDTIAYRIGFSGQQETIPAKGIRTVVHNNKYRRFSIPLEVGCSKSIKRFNLGISGGIGFNYLIAQNGKSLNKDENIQSIHNGSKQNRAYRKAFPSYHLTPFISYHLTDKITLNINHNLRYQMHGKSEFYRLKQSSLFLGLNIGVLHDL